MIQTRSPVENWFIISQETGLFFKAAFLKYKEFKFITYENKSTEIDAAIFFYHNVACLAFWYGLLYNQVVRMLGKTL